jgi:hypothetical protein
MWRAIKIWHLALALSRGTMQWWNDPRSGRSVLRSQSGRVYDYCWTNKAWYIRPRPLIPIPD